MTLYLKENEVCPYQTRCPHNNCRGSDNNRGTSFTCSFVDEHGRINENGCRNPLDQTGTQVIVNE